ncbi:MAG: hypothetical protein JXA93_02170 [Anaerolineae bacterium]|nr:hypothetical protein [Anaerolineae bacterium]
MGAVVSQDFTSLSDLWGALAFHAIATGLGTGLVGKGMAARREPVAPAG